jgi:AcrR family transcriptional regulator
VRDLPLAGPRPGGLNERADAARNRQRILEATATLVAERGICNVSMEDVAKASGVGTGTLYRRFGDRAGLALALLDEQARTFQDQLISGPPPLGPGAPAAERLRAFGVCFLDLLDHQAEILAVGAPAGGAGPYTAYATHLAILLRDAAPHLDAEFTAHALLAPLSPAIHLHLRGDLGWSMQRLRDGWTAMVDALAGPPE